MPEKDVIFISWSGKDTASFRMAEILNKVLPVVFQSAECFLSDDIDKGTIGINEILVNLSKAKIGIICVTKANIEKTWLNFEAGALASAVFNKNGRAITLLIDMTTDEYAAANSPIRNLQATILEETDLLKMFMSINKSLDNALSESQLKLLFDSVAKNKILGCNIDTFTTDIHDIPTYIQALQMLLEKYNQSGRRLINTNDINVDKKDILILEHKGYIEITSRRFDGSCLIKLTGKAFEFEESNERYDI